MCTVRAEIVICPHSSVGEFVILMNPKKVHQIMTNAQLADTLDLLADLLEFQGANPFRTRAYRNGSRAIRDMPESLATLVASDKDLTEN